MDRRKYELESAKPGSECFIDFEGKRLSAKEGEPLMVTLLAHGIETASRSVKYHRPRGSFCMAGICGQCWMRIDDLPNRAACTSRSRPGLVAMRENAFPSADLDWFRAADLVFAGGLDHHRLGTTSIGPLNAIMQDTARRMAGLGSLSTTPAAPAPAVARRAVDLAVVGGGVAGLAAACAAAGAGLKTVVIEAREVPGGRLRSGLYDDVPALAQLPAAAIAALKSAGGELWLDSIASGIYKDADAHAELLVRRDVGLKTERLVKIEARTLILANGGYEQSPLFESNDLPGHYGARAVAELVNRFQILPGKRVVIAGSDEETAARLERSLRAIGVAAVRVVEPSDAADRRGQRATGDGSADSIQRGRITAARGGTHVKGVEIAPLEGARGEAIRIACDIIASAMPLAPAFELARQAGCAIDYRPLLGGFAVVADPGSGRTSVERLFAAGEVTGTMPAEHAALEGEIAGLSAVLEHKDEPAAHARREALLGSRERGRALR